MHIGLQGDEGCKKYLQTMSLRNNVTDDNYTFFSNEDVCACIYRAMLCMQPLRKLEQPAEECRVLNDGRREYRYIPDTTREIVGVVAEIVIPPGGQMSIAFPHGVIGRMQGRKVLLDGTAKRKS